MLYSREVGIPVVTITLSLYACFLCLTFSVLIYFIEHDCCLLNIVSLSHMQRTYTWHTPLRW